MKTKVFAVLIFWLICCNFLYGAIDVLIYGDHADKTANAFSNIDGFQVVWTQSVDDIPWANLSAFDVFFAATSYENDLDSKASVIQQFLLDGGGVVVGQSNVSGYINWLPSDVSVYVNSKGYPSPYSLEITPFGQTHPIMEGIVRHDLGTVPADTIYSNDLAPSWDVLSVYAPNPDIIGMAVNHYGPGRLLLWPENLSPTSLGPPSERLIQQAFEWVAVPEPTAVLLLGLGALCIPKQKV